MGFGFQQGSTSKNRQNSQSGVNFNSPFLLAMNQYTGGRQNPFTFMQPSAHYYGPNPYQPQQQPWQQQYYNPYGAGPQPSHQMGWNPYTYGQQQEQQQQQYYQTGGEQAIGGQKALTSGARNPYRVDWGAFVAAQQQADPGKAQDLRRLARKAQEYAAAQGQSFDINNMSYDQLNWIVDNVNRIDPDFSGRSQGALEAARGHISSQQRLLQDYGPGYQPDFDPRTQFGASMPEDLRKAYESGTATGQSWDGHRWVEATGNPDLIRDENTGRYFYRGQEINEEQFNQIQQHGPQGAPQQPPADRFQFDPRRTPIYTPQVNVGRDARYDQTMNRVLSEDERMFMNAEEFRNWVRTPQLQSPHLDRRGIGVDPAQVAGPSLINLQGGKQLRDAIYDEMTAVPMQQFERRKEQQKEQFMAQLAQAGLADSKAGAEQLFQDVYEPILNQESALMQQAGATATRLARDYDLQVAMANQKARQETNLANAGFTQEARINTARNFLTSNISEYENRMRGAMQTQSLQQQAQISNMQQYAQALGINVQSVFKMRDQFLGALGLMQEDRRLDAQIAQQNADRMMQGQQLGLQRDQLGLDAFQRTGQLNLQSEQLALDRIRQMSEHDRQMMSIAFQAYMAEMSALTNAGRYSTSIGRSSTDGGWNFQVT